jgi:hypothetical protein
VQPPSQGLCSLALSSAPGPAQVLALCLGRGPLLLPYAGFWQFCGALMLPVIPSAAFRSSGGAGLQQGERSPSSTQARTQPARTVPPTPRPPLPPPPALAPAGKAAASAGQLLRTYLRQTAKASPTCSAPPPPRSAAAPAASRTRATSRLRPGRGRQRRGRGLQLISAPDLIGAVQAARQAGRQAGGRAEPAEHQGRAPQPRAPIQAPRRTQEDDARVLLVGGVPYVAQHLEAGAQRVLADVQVAEEQPPPAAASDLSRAVEVVGIFAWLGADRKWETVSGIGALDKQRRPLARTAA